MFYVSLVMSSFLFVVTTLAVWLAPNRKKAYGLCWLGLAFGIFPGCLVLSTYLLHALLSVSWRRRASSRAAVR